MCLITRRNKALRGFSLFELMIVGLLIALLVGLAIPSMRSLSGAQLRSEAVRVTSLIKDSFTRSALVGQTYRVVFDLDANTYWVEVTTDAVSLSDPMEHKGDQKGILDFLSPADEKDKQKNNVLLGPEFKAVKGEFGEKQKLGDDVRIFGVWAEHLSERVRSGQVALYFFPDGYTEEAQITLTDDREGKRVIVLIVNPLTAQVRVEREEPEIGGEK